MIKYLLKIIFGITFYEAPKDIPVDNNLRLEHFFSAEYRNDLTHDIPAFSKH